MRIKSICLLLACLMLCGSFVSCKKGEPDQTIQSAEDTSATPPTDDTTVEIPGSDETKIPVIPEVPAGENSVRISSEDLLSLIRSDAVAENGDYLVEDGYGLVFNNSQDRGKTYDLKNAVIRIGVSEDAYGFTLQAVREMTLQNGVIAVYGGAAIGLVKARNCVFSNLHFSGNASAAMELGGTDITVNACTFASAEGATLEAGVIALGSNVTVTNCNVSGLKNGVIDRSENGAVIENNLFNGCEVGVSMETANTVVWYNTISGGKYGVRAVFEKSELSAAMSKGYNLMVSMNEISGADTSVLFQNVSNGVILFNELETAEVSGCTNAYVSKNQISESLVLNRNNYLIANANEAAQLTAAENQNVNGDDLTDVTARAEVGANEELVPHINTEQFVGMSRVQTVRTAEGSVPLKEYLANALAEEKVVIVPPGAYYGEPMRLEGISDSAIYAYGVLNENGTSKEEYFITFVGCENTSLYGMFLGTAIYPFIQGTVRFSGTKNGKSQVTFVSDPGYRENFTNGNYFTSTPAGFYFKPGYDYPEIDFGITGKSYDMATKVNTVYLNQSWTTRISKGDRIAFRSGLVGGGIEFDACTEMKLEDVTVTSCSGFAEHDVANEVAPVLHRFAVVRGPAPVLDGSGDYSDFGDLIWTDSYGRLRSAQPVHSTCDGAHSTNSRTGIQIVSCLFERLYDDAGNIKGSYGLATAFNASTDTLTYTTCDINTYKLLPSPFRTGDEIMLYTIKGKFVGRGTVTEGTAELGNDLYSVRISTDVTLPSGEDVVVQNLSACGKGFLIDNVVVRDVACNGFRIKAPGGEVRNSTFDGLSKAGIACWPGFDAWPEVGYAENLKITKNVFNRIGNTTRDTSAESDMGWCSPIMIKYNNDNKATANFTSDLDYCLHHNIEISENVFTDRHCPYAIAISAASNITISNNTFGAKLGVSDAADNQSPILLFGANGVVIEGNDYPQGVTDAVDYRKSGITENITGSDVN